MKDLSLALMQLAQVCDADPEFVEKCMGSIRPEKEKLQVRSWCYDLERLKLAAAALPRRSFQKTYDDDHFNIVCQLTDLVQVVLYIDRDKVCKRKVTWDCQDAESVLLQMPSAEAEEEVLP